MARTFRDGHAETWWAADAELGWWGPDGARRLVAATADPATLPDKATCYLVTNLPRPGGPREARQPAPAAGLALACWARIYDRGGDLLSSGSSVALSGGDLVLVDEPAKDLFSADPVLGEVDPRWPGGSLSRRELAKGTVRPGCVVMQQVLSQHPAQVVLINEQQPVEKFPAEGADHPLADRVRSGGPPRR